MTNTAQGLPLNQYMAGQVAQPTLPAGVDFTPQLLPTDNAALTNQGQLMTGQAGTVPTNAPVTGAPPVPSPTINASQGQAQGIDSAVPLQQINPGAGQYAASTGIPAQQGVAEQGTVNEMSTVKGQLKQLYAESQPGMTPEWAKGAVTAANEASAARGIGASSIGVAAIAAAIQNAALPIAAQDASTYFQMDLTNLNNRQTMVLENLKNRQQSLLSDQAATNAAAQFNASSETQVQQFMATLVSNIMTQNADRKQAMEVFNAGQTNQIEAANVANQINVGQFNTQQEKALQEFNAQQKFLREQFNANAAFAIEQSNVLWRRQINTENTAAINAANQTNAQNRFDLSATAQNQLWQQWRDEASWMVQASENEKDRQFNMAMAANNGQYYSPANGSNWSQAAGAFVSGLLIK